MPGCTVRVEGLCEGVAVKTSEKTGEVTHWTRVVYMGGKQFLTFADSEQAAFCKKGDTVLFEADLDLSGPRAYVGRARLLAVNGKALGGGK